MWDMEIDVTISALLHGVNNVVYYTNLEVWIPTIGSVSLPRLIIVEIFGARLVNSDVDLHVAY